MDCVFETEGGAIVATSRGVGPWDPGLLHGGAPASLVARALEGLPTLKDMRISRLTIDLMRPVPVGPLQVDSRIVRDGRKIQLCEVVIKSGDTEVVRASGLKIRVSEQILPDTTFVPPFDFDPPAEDLEVAPVPGMHGFGSGISFLPARGAFGVPGPASVWFRANRPMVQGETTSPLMRAALTSDFCNGVGSIVPISDWTYINADLTVHLARDPIGSWILVDAHTVPSNEGRALSLGRLADRHGWFGQAIQSTLLEKRR
jgi:hypothetical protein